MPDSAAVARALATAGTKPVNITPGPTPTDVPTVDQHPCRISNKNNGQIVWQVKANPPLPFRVIFAIREARIQRHRSGFGPAHCLRQ
jgi:hypothetical protein